MSLFCTQELFEALEGVQFPATKDDLLDYAEMKDAPEAVVVTLNGLRDDILYNSITAVCENARVACTYEIVKTLRDVQFPASREELIDCAQEQDAPSSTIHALEALPSKYSFGSLDEVCEYIL